MEAVLPVVYIKQELIEEEEYECPTQGNCCYDPSTSFVNADNESTEERTANCDLTHFTDLSTFVKTENIEGSIYEDYERDDNHQELYENPTADYELSNSTDMSAFIKSEIVEDTDRDSDQQVTEENVESEFVTPEFIEVKMDPSTMATMEMTELETFQTGEKHLPMLQHYKEEIVDIESDVSSEAPLDNEEIDRNSQESLLNKDDTVCTLCNEDCISFKGRVLHMRERHENIVFTYFEDVKKHTGSQLSNKPLTCHICGKGYRLKISLRNHLLLHKGSCFKCSYTNADFDTLKVHIRTHDPYKCEICGYSTYRRNLLIVHKEKHSVKKTIQCNFCNYTAEDSVDLENHMHTHSIKEPFCCDICDFKGYDKLELKSHMLGHIRGKALKCNTCNFMCYCWRDLNKHIQQHDREQKLQQKCNICDFSTIDKKCLKTHMRTHPKERLCVCNVCKRSYQNSSQLRKHMKRHIRS